jgi:hypothetical protein
MAYKLGLGPKKLHRLTLDFNDYVAADALPPPPEKAFFEYKIDPSKIQMFGNDQYGDCVFADIAHAIMLFTAHSGKMFTPTLADILAAYGAVTGFDPATGANDNGTSWTDALAYWQSTGVAGHKILGWASIDPKNVLHRKLGVYLFLATHLGVQFPAIGQTQFAAGQTWDVAPNDGGIEGGHAILQSGYGSAGMNVESWGKGDQKASNAWDAAYTDECYIVLTEDIIDAASGLSYTGFDLAALTADLAAMKQ